MSWNLAVLGLFAMTTACGSPYGETAPIPLPGRTESTSLTEAPASKDATNQTKAVTTTAPAHVVAGPPSAIAFAWNEASPTAEYSLDVLMKDGALVGPCISVEWIHRELTTTFRGSCPSSQQYPTIAMADIEGFQVCSAENDDWSSARCTKTVWDGAAPTITFDN